MELNSKVYDRTIFLWVLLPLVLLPLLLGSKRFRNFYYNYDTFTTFIVPIIVVVGFYMYFNPSSSLTKSYEQVVNDKRQRRRELRQSLGINVQPT